MDWMQHRLGDIVSAVSGQVDPTGPKHKTRPYVGPHNIVPNSGRLVDVISAEEARRKSGMYEFDSSHVLYCKIGPMQNKVALPDFDGICGSEIYPLIVDEEKITREFLAYSLRQPKFLNYVRKHSNRAVIPKMNRKMLFEYVISVPPIDEQERIATILDKTSDIHRNSKLAASLQNELINNVFLEMFGDPRVNDNNWPTKPLIEIATLQRGFDLPVQNRAPGSVPILASNGRVGYHNESKVMGPGVVTGRSGSLGHVQFVDQDYWPLNTSLWVKNFHGNEPRWIAHLLRHMNLQNFTRGSGVPTLNRNLVHVVEVIHPPIELQKKFVAFELSIQSVFEPIIASSQNSFSLFSSITQEIFK